jgi:hypothetical protein
MVGHVDWLADGSGRVGSFNSLGRGMHKSKQAVSCLRNQASIELAIMFM